MILSFRLFSNPAGSTTTPGSRKRRALPTSEVAAAVMKSSPVPISNAEAFESLTILTSLCPFFLRPLDITGEEWLEMPAPSTTGESEGDSSSTLGNILSSPKKAPSSPRKMPSSPGKNKSKDQSAEELRTRSPRTVKREGGGLREVRERIRREIELQD